MIEKSELLRVPVFADLPDDQIDWFISQSQEIAVKAGETYLHQGDPADAMFVILEGQLQQGRRYCRRAALLANEVLHRKRTRYY
jgi:hypothetical protein